jgi:peptidase E
MKRLFLASEAKDPESMVKLEKFVGGFNGKSIAFIPTALNGTSKFGEWKTESGSFKLVQTLGMEVSAVQLEDFKNSSVAEVLKGKDILWFAGGATGYLLYWIRRCKLDKALPELLEKSIYVGSSAGSMVCSKTQIASECFIGEEEPGASLLPGLGYIDFEIYPHYEDELLPEIKKFWKGGELCLLKNGEAITVVGDKIEFLGEKRILKNGIVKSG